jgi:hypothetical protein
MNPGDLHPTIAPITGGGSTTQLGEVRSPYWAVGVTPMVGGVTALVGSRKRMMRPARAR